MGLLLTTRTKLILIVILTVSLFSAKNPLGETVLIFTKKNNLGDTFLKENFIPLLLVNSINSHLRGRVIGVVEHNCYAEHGNKIIIPKGSKATGFYLPIKSYSQERLIIKWNRLITPEGEHISLAKSETADANGIMGVLGDLDKRYWERYGLSFALSTLTNYMSLKVSLEEIKSSKDTNNSLESEYISKYKEQTTNDSKSIIDQILKEQLMTKPIMYVEKGTKLLISPRFDIKIQK